MLESETNPLLDSITEDAEGRLDITQLFLNLTPLDFNRALWKQSKIENHPMLVIKIEWDESSMNENTAHRLKAFSDSGSAQQDRKAVIICSTQTKNENRFFGNVFASGVVWEEKM